jgi:hypothetical protein
MDEKDQVGFRFNNEGNNPVSQQILAEPADV